MLSKNILRAATIISITAVWISAPFLRMTKTTKHSSRISSFTSLLPTYEETPRRIKFLRPSNSTTIMSRSPSFHTASCPITFTSWSNNTPTTPSTILCAHLPPNMSDTLIPNTIESDHYSKAPTKQLTSLMNTSSLTSPSTSTATPSPFQPTRSLLVGNSTPTNTHPIPIILDSSRNHGLQKMTYSPISPIPIPTLVTKTSSKTQSQTTLQLSKITQSILSNLQGLSS